MRVYLAARFSRLEEIVQYATELEAIGIDVTSRWIRGDHEWTGTDDENIPVDELARFAIEDLEDLVAADMIVCFTEPPQSGPARGGRHTEFGFAMAMGIQPLVVGHRENVFYCLPDVEFAPDWPTAKQFLITRADSVLATITANMEPLT